MKRLLSILLVFTLSADGSVFVRAGSGGRKTCPQVVGVSDFTAFRLYKDEITDVTKLFSLEDGVIQFKEDIDIELIRDEANDVCQDVYYAIVWNDPVAADGANDDPADADGEDPTDDSGESEPGDTLYGVAAIAPLSESSLTDALKAIESLNTPEKIETALTSHEDVKDAGNITVIDVTALYRSDENGQSPEGAPEEITAEQLAESGADILLRFADLGVSQEVTGDLVSYDFTVLHMFADDTADKDGTLHKAGEIEVPEIGRITQDGLWVHIASVSPFAVSWDKNDDDPDSPSPGDDPGTDPHDSGDHSGSGGGGSSGGSGGSGGSGSGGGSSGGSSGSWSRPGGSGFRPSGSGMRPGGSGMRSSGRSGFGSTGSFGSGSRSGFGISGSSSGEPTGVTITTQELSTGSVTTYDFGRIRIHAYSADNEMDEAAYAVESSSALTGISMPADEEAYTAWNEYLDTLEKPLTGIFMTGTPLNPEDLGSSDPASAEASAEASEDPAGSGSASADPGYIPLFATEAVSEYFRSDEAAEALAAVAEALGEHFRLGEEFAEPTIVLTPDPDTHDAEFDLEGVTYTVTEHDSSYDIRISSVGAVFSPIPGKDSFGLYPDADAFDSVLQDLRSYENAMSDEAGPGENISFLFGSSGRVIAPEDMEAVITGTEALKALAEESEDADSFIEAATDALPDYQGAGALAITAASLFPD